MAEAYGIKFHGVIANPSAPGGEVGMYEVFNAHTRATAFSLGVPADREGEKKARMIVRTLNAYDRLVRAAVVVENAWKGGYLAQAIRDLSMALDFSDTEDDGLTRYTVLLLHPESENDNPITVEYTVFGKDGVDAILKARDKACLDSDGEYDPKVFSVLAVMHGHVGFHMRASYNRGETTLRQE